MGSCEFDYLQVTISYVSIFWLKKKKTFLQKFI